MSNTEQQNTPNTPNIPQVEKITKEDRLGFEEAIKAMVMRTDLREYVFYATMISACKIIFTRAEVPTAGVSYHINKYYLYINPDFFNKQPVEIQLGILKHEMLHILYNHVSRKQTRVHTTFNYATDCAINQQIIQSHLTAGCITPKSLSEMVGKTIPVDKSGEQYYEMIKDDIKDDSECSGDCNGGEGSDSSCGNGKECTCGHEDGNGYHGKWEEATGNEDIRKDVTRRMVEKSMRVAKQRGTVPSNADEWLDSFTNKPQISWRQELKKITGNKRCGKRGTILKRNRRQRDRPDLRGSKTNRTFTVVAVADISGSMSNEQIMTGLTEIHEICKITNSELVLIQVDTQIHGVEKFSKNTKLFNRKGCGGTVMSPAMTYIKENNIECDVCVLITDGYIEDISAWDHPPRKLMALVVDGAQIPGLDSYPGYKQFDIEAQR